MHKLEHKGPISSVAAQGGLIATAGYDNRVILWNDATHEPISQGLHDHLVNHCEFSHDGNYLVTASSDYSARVWRLPEMRLEAVLGVHKDDVDMATFSPDDQLVATCALDRVVRIFNRQGQCLKELYGHVGNIISVMWSADGNQLVSSSVDGTVREWDVESGEQLACHDLDTVRTDTIAFDNQGQILAGDDHGRIAIISKTGIVYHQAHRAGIKKLVYSSDREILATLSYDRSLAIWKTNLDGSPLICLNRTEIPAVIWPRAAAVLDAQRLVVGTFGTRYAIYDWTKDAWDVEDVSPGNGINAVICHDGAVFTVGDAGNVLRDGQLVAEMGSLCNFLVSADHSLFTGGQLGTLFDALSGKALYQHHSPLNCGVYFYSAGKPHLAVGSYTGEAVIFRIADDGQITKIKKLKVFDNAIKGLATSGSQLFAACASTDIAWIDGEFLEVMNKQYRAHEKIVNACALVGDKGFATVSRDKTLRLWMNGVQEIYQSPHPNSVKSLCSSADGSVLMTGSYGGTIAGFDVKTRSWITFRRPTTAGISSITYNEKNNNFLAAAYDGSLHVIN
jgi:WD40 repeat protein